MKGKVGVTKMSDEQVLGFGNSLVSSGTGKLSVETVSPKLSEVGTAADETAAAFEAESVAEAALATARTERIAKANTLRAVITLYAQAIDSKYEGDVALLQAIGLEIRNPALPVGPLPAPANVRSVAGPIDGSVTVRWNHVRGRYIFEAECAPSPTGPWTPCYQVGRVADPHAPISRRARNIGSVCARSARPVLPRGVT